MFQNTITLIPMSYFRNRALFPALLLFSLVFNFHLHAQTSPYTDAHDDEFFVMLESYTNYGGDIKVIDGLTGQEYHAANEVVIDFHKSMPKIMGGYHNLLLQYESAYINQGIGDIIKRGKRLRELSDSFGLKGFRFDEERLINRENAIFSRLKQKPIFKIRELVVWDLDQMEPGALPKNTWAQNVQFDKESQNWQRRILAKWEARVQRSNSTITVIREQGLNIDTQAGFQDINLRLPSEIHASHFRDVTISYPIFITKSQDNETQAKALKRAFINNIRHLYDPFSWRYSRSDRFHSTLLSELIAHLNSRQQRSSEPNWFMLVMSHLLHCVAIAETRGYPSVYQQHVRESYESLHSGQLGDNFDPLNWHPKENRIIHERHRARLLSDTHFERPFTARWIVFDAYLRYGDAFLEILREEVTSLKKKDDPIAAFKRALARASKTDADKYIRLAGKQQMDLMQNHLAAYQKATSPQSSNSH